MLTSVPEKYAHFPLAGVYALSFGLARAADVSLGFTDLIVYMKSTHTTVSKHKSRQKFLRVEEYTRSQDEHELVDKTSKLVMFVM